jgi:hypothetical protein
MPTSPNRICVINGEKVPMFYIGTLANSLNRTATSIRIWESKGIIPKSWFKDKFGKRMYTQEQIDIIVECANECEIAQGRKMSMTDFSVECHRRFAELHKKYFGGK